MIYEIMIRTKNIILLLAFVLLAACEKDEDTMSKGKLLLTTEKHQSQQKTSVEGTTVQWVGGDKDTIRFYVGGYAAQNYTVFVNDKGEACVDIENERTGDVRAYYPTAIITASGALNGNSDAPTVVIPNRYDSYFNGGRQVLALPMVAKGNTSDNKVEFKHLTAAINVTIKNSIGSELKLDRVVISSKDYKLSGTMLLSLTDENNLGVVAQSVTDDSNAVTVRLTDNPTIANNGTITVQVPIRPIGETEKPLRIEVFAYRQGSLIGGSGVPMVYSTKVYHYNDAKNVSSLGRKVMMTAGIEIKTPGSGIHTTIEDIDNSLFSVSGSKKVHFSKGNLKHTTDGWAFHTNQYDRSASQSDAERDLFGWNTSSTPNNISTNSSDYVVSSFTDWGSNTIADAGAAGSWRTLSSDEWNYLLNTRPGKRFAKACVNGANGLIIFSDTYAQPSGIPLQNVNINLKQDANSFSDYNNYTTEQWTSMQASGAIFLPAAGYRTGSTVNSAAGAGHYWSSTYYGESSTRRLLFSLSEFYATNYESITNGCSVRLVKEN